MGFSRGSAKGLNGSGFYSSEIEMASPITGFVPKELSHAGLIAALSYMLLPGQHCQARASRPSNHKHVRNFPPCTGIFGYTNWIYLYIYIYTDLETGRCVGYACMYACVPVCVRVRACTRACMHASMHVCLHVCVCLCVCKQRCCGRLVHDELDKFGRCFNSDRVGSRATTVALVLRA